MIIFYILLSIVTAGMLKPETQQERIEIQNIKELFRLRNAHKADSAALLYADTVLVYMKHFRNIPRKIITQSDQRFWKSHPKNKFEITAPIQITTKAGIVTAIIYGKEYLDGTDFQYEKIEIQFDRYKKINSFRGFKWKKEN
jgi:hypothetical protein